MKGIVSYYNRGNKLNRDYVRSMREEGYLVQEINIMEKRWKKEDLMKFIGDNIVHRCINVDADAITREGLDIYQYTEDQLLDLMVEYPVLIMEPLVFFRGEFSIGYESSLLDKLMGNECLQMCK